MILTIRFKHKHPLKYFDIVILRFGRTFPVLCVDIIQRNRNFAAPFVAFSWFHGFTQITSEISGRYSNSFCTVTICRKNTFAQVHRMEIREILNSLQHFINIKHLMFHRIVVHCIHQNQNTMLYMAICH